MSSDFFPQWFLTLYIFIYVFRVAGPLLSCFCSWSLSLLHLFVSTRLLSGSWVYRTEKLLSAWTGAETPPLYWSGLSDTHSDHGHQRDQSLGWTRLNGDGEWRAHHHHAKRQTQNLGGESAEDENRFTRERNVGWEIWFSSLLCRIRNRTRKCLEISLFMWKKRRR